MHRPSRALEFAETAIGVGDCGVAIGESEDDERTVIAEKCQFPMRTVLGQQCVEVIVPAAGTPKATIEDRHEQNE